MIFNTIEGTDFSGKTTLFNLLKIKLRGFNFNKNDIKEYKSKDIIFIKNPSSTALGCKVKELILEHRVSPLTRFLLYQGAFHDLLLTARPLKNITIWERSPISGIAYSGLPLTTLRVFFKKVILNKVIINNVLILKIDKPTLEDRMRRHTDPLDYIEDEGVEYLLKRQQGIIDITKEMKAWGLVNNYQIVPAGTNLSEYLEIAKDFLTQKP